MLPDSVSVPVPVDLVRAPANEITPENSCVVDDAKVNVLVELVSSIAPA